MLAKIKLLLGITDTSKDSLLQVLIDNATAFALNYTHRDTIVGANLDSAITKMVVFDYNRLGSEGLSSESYSGLNFNYLSDYPADIFDALKAKRKVQLVVSNDSE